MVDDIKLGKGFPLQCRVSGRFQEADKSRMSHRNLQRRSEDKWSQIPKGNRVEVHEAQPVSRIMDERVMQRNVAYMVSRGKF